MRIRLAALVLFLGIFTGTNVFAVSSVNVPLDNWTYPALDKLAGFGLLHSDLKGTRPFTRMEVARLVHEALMESETVTGPLPQFALFLLEKFKKEYNEELGAYGSGDTIPPSTFLKPLEEVQARYVYVDGEPRAFVNLRQGQGQYPQSSSRIVAFEGTPLLENNEGILYGKGSNGSLQFSSSLRLIDFFSAYIQPIVVVRQNEGHVPSFDDINVAELPGNPGSFNRAEADLVKGYAKLSEWNTELEVGRDSMWWGQGRHGDLILTNNGTPLDLVKLSNPTPSLLPWYFSYLGPFKYTFFTAILEGDGLATNPWMTGLRFNFKPTSTLEIGLMNTFLYNGKGQPSLSFQSFIGSLTGFGFSANNIVNQIAGVDFRLQFPFLRNTELYGEYSGDDSGGIEFPEEVPGLGDVGYIIGIYVPRLTDDGRSDLRLEFANNAHRVDATPGFWYGHGIYPYTHDELIMGHNMGPDAYDVFVRTTRYFGEDLVVGLDYDYMARGVTLSAPVDHEHINQVGADATYDINKWMNICVRYAFQTVENFDIQAGGDRQDQLLMTTLKLQF